MHDHGPATDRHVYRHHAGLTARRGWVARWERIASRGREGRAGGGTRAIAPGTECPGRRGSRPGHRCPAGISTGTCLTACTSSGWALARIWLGPWPFCWRRRTEARPLALLPPTEARPRGSSSRLSASCGRSTTPGARGRALRRAARERRGDVRVLECGGNQSLRCSRRAANSNADLDFVCRRTRERERKDSPREELEALHSGVVPLQGRGAEVPGAPEDCEGAPLQGPLQIPLRADRAARGRGQGHPARCAGSPRYGKRLPNVRRNPRRRGDVPHTRGSPPRQARRRGFQCIRRWPARLCRQGSSFGG